MKFRRLVPKKGKQPLINIVIWIRICGWGCDAKLYLNTAFYEGNAELMSTITGLKATLKRFRP